MHKITVSSYQEVKEDDPDEFRLVKAVGKIPPEYPDYDDDDEDEDESYELPKCAVKPSPSGRGYKAPTNLCLHNI